MRKDSARKREADRSLMCLRDLTQVAICAASTATRFSCREASLERNRSVGRMRKTSAATRAAVRS